MITEVEKWKRERLLEALDSYRLGLSDAPHIRKWSDQLSPDLAPLGFDAEYLGEAGPQTTIPASGSRRQVASNPGQSSNGLDREMTFVVSTDDVDRHGDVVSVQGWRLESYVRNPVFLWAHEYAQPAIGRAVVVWKEENRLMARIQFAPTDFAQEVASLYRGGYQRGVSVGFSPLHYQVKRDAKSGEVTGINFTEQELMEISAAPVPANQNALRKALDAAPRMRGYYHYRGLDEDRLLGEMSAHGPVSGLVSSAQDMVGDSVARPMIASQRAFQEFLDALRAVRHQL